MPTASRAIAKYRRLRDWADRRVRQLLDLHGHNIVCRPGCTDCCTNLTVFPVEYASILDELRTTGPAAANEKCPAGQADPIFFDSDAPCGYLRDGRCAIYRARPLICRTHGLPIAFLDEESEPPGHSVSFCPRNFASCSGQGGGETACMPEFGPDNTLDLDELNRELFEANVDYLREQADEELGPTDRVELARLAGEINRVE